MEWGGRNEMGRPGSKKKKKKMQKRECCVAEKPVSPNSHEFGETGFSEMQGGVLVQNPKWIILH